MFPSFNWYSTPLFVLYIWGILFSGLLFYKYWEKRNISHLFLAFVLLLHTFDRTTYTIGFMDWYDTYRNTKVNYFLFNTQLLFAPLIFFYIRSVTENAFKFKKKDWLHFLPWMTYFSARIFIYLYDINQSGFDNVQNGVLYSWMDRSFLGLFINSLTTIVMTVYLFVSIQYFWNYRKKILELFSNTHQLELNWIRNFLAIFTILFFALFIATEIDDSIFNLTYTDYWWGHLAAAISLIYLGWYGYFLDIKQLDDDRIEAGAITLEANNNEKEQIIEIDEELLAGHQVLKRVMKEESPYLNAGLTLAKLAKRTGLNNNKLSQIINKCEKMNFNDYINSHRIDAVKKSIQAGRADQFTLLTIAYECGFNSKATFNRTFKKFTNQSPSEYLQNINKSDFSS